MCSCESSDAVRARCSDATIYAVRVQDATAARKHSKGLFSLSLEHWWCGDRDCRRNKPLASVLHAASLAIAKKLFRTRPRSQRRRRHFWVQKTPGIGEICLASEPISLSRENSRISIAVAHADAEHLQASSALDDPYVRAKKRGEKVTLVSRILVAFYFLFRTEQIMARRRATTTTA